MTKGVQGLKKSIIAVVTGFTVAAGILSGGITRPPWWRTAGTGGRGCLYNLYRR